jgi:hypothetical protein
LAPHEEIIRHIEAILPREKVQQEARSFLETCGWSLEIGEKLISIPRETELGVRSRAFIRADAEDVFLEDHYEAVVIIGIESLGEHQRAKYGVLRMYFNLNGEFISEDRYNEYC